MLTLYAFSKIFWPRCKVCGILVPGPEIEPVSPARAVLSLNHWAVSEVSICSLMSGWKSPFWSLTPVLQIQIYSSSFLSPALHLRDANPSRLHLQLSGCLASGSRQEETVAGGWSGGKGADGVCSAAGGCPAFRLQPLLPRRQWVQLLPGDAFLRPLVIPLLLFVPAAQGVASCFLLISGLFDFLQVDLSAIPPV